MCIPDLWPTIRFLTEVVGSALLSVAIEWWVQRWTRRK